MNKLCYYLGLCCVVNSISVPSLHAQQNVIVPVGEGGYFKTLPAGAREPTSILWKTDNIHAPIPTNKWWSSLVASKYSQPMYAHPLTLQACAEGMKIYYPGPSIYANKIGIFGEMQEKGDFILGHSSQKEFPDARLADFSDWFVTASFASEQNSMLVTFGHGSPYIYAQYKGGNPKLTFTAAPTVWFGSQDTAVLGVTVNKRHYALFGPAGSSWTIDGPVYICNSNGKSYFSAAILPDNSTETLKLFQRYAYSHVIGTKVGWLYNQQTSSVSTTYDYALKNFEGKEQGTLFALYPHQWMNTTSPLIGSLKDNTLHFDSVNGKMVIGKGSQFTTSVKYHGILPALPYGGDSGSLRELLKADAGASIPDSKDTYWEGKYLGKLTTLSGIAEQVGDKLAETKLLTIIKKRLEGWLSASPPEGKSGGIRGFYYNQNWGTLIGYPASFGSDTELNDHHFHYGYFLRAAAEIARHDPRWASDAKWGKMLKMIVREIAGSDRNDAMFPFLRNYDVYAGHSWASGFAAFASGNNNESSSEGMNAWSGIALLGDAIGDRNMRDLGIYLYTSEMEGINACWFDVTNKIRPTEYTPSVVTMVWGGKLVNETWFSNRPSIIHGINWLPFQSGSLYLGLYPVYAERNYQALKKENGGDNFTDWADLVWMYRAFSDPADAMRMLNERADKYSPEDGNTRSNVYQWIAALKEYGAVDSSITANTSEYAVFKKGSKTTYIFYNSSDAPINVKFSDGRTINTSKKGFTVQTK